MKTLKTTLFAGVAALAFGVTAQAQTQAQSSAPSQPQAQSQGQHRHWQDLTPEQRAQFTAKRAELRAKRTQQLHDELGITPGQETAWKSFVASMQPAPHPQQDRAAWAALSAPERMAKKIELQKQHTAALQQRQGALNSFYSVLSADQKKVFDAKSAQMAMGGHGRHGGHGEHGRRAAQG
jgi:protein CpxP